MNGRGLQQCASTVIISILTEEHKRGHIFTMRCAEITLRHTAPLAVPPLEAGACSSPGKLLRDPSRLVCQSHCASILISHWHSVSRLQHVANENLGASFQLLRFYKASRSPAAAGIQRNTQARNNKRPGEGMSIPGGQAARQQNDVGMKTERSFQEVHEYRSQLDNGNHELEVAKSPDP